MVEVILRGLERSVSKVSLFEAWGLEFRSQGLGEAEISQPHWVSENPVSIMWKSIAEDQCWPLASLPYAYICTHLYERIHHMRTCIHTTRHQVIFKKWFILCVSCLYACMCTLCVLGILIISPGIGVTDVCKPPCRCWEPNPGPLQELQVLLTTELYHQISIPSHLKGSMIGYLNTSAGLSRWLSG